MDFPVYLLRPGDVAVAVFVAGLGVALCARAAWQETPAVTPAGESRLPEKQPNSAVAPSEAKRVRADRLGDVLPQQALARLGTLRFVHPGHVQVLAFSPNGKVLASAGNGPTICLWDPSSGKALVKLKGHQNGVCALSWSSDGKVLASGSFDGTARLWDPRSGKTLHILKAGEDPFTVSCVCFSPDGKIVATGDTLIRLWDTANGKPVRVLEGQTAKTLDTLSWSPDGKVLASGSGTTIRLWDPLTGKSLRIWKAHEIGIMCLCWSHGGKVLASTSEDHTVRLWDRTSGGMLRVLKGHGGRIEVVAWSPDDKVLIGSSWSSRLNMWDSASGKLLPSLNKFPVTALSWSDDGSTVALADGQKIHLLDPATQQLKEFAELADTHAGSVNSLALSPDGKLLASASSDSTIRLWNTDSGKTVRLVKLKFSQGNALAWSRDGKVLASEGVNATIGLWKPAGGEAKRIFWPVENLSALAWSRDSSVLAAAGWGEDHSIALWDGQSGKRRRLLKGHTDDVQSLSWSPDGELLASGGIDRTVRIWDAARGTTMRVLKEHPGGVSTVAWSGDGKVLASGGGDTVRLWDPVIGRLLRVFDEPHSVWPVSWSPDSKVLASATHDGTIRLRERVTGQLIRVLERHQGPVRATAFSPDGRRLYSGSADTTVLVWDVTGLEAAGPPPKDLSAAAIDAMWQELGAEARVAHPAIWKLAAASDRAVRFLKARLRAVAAVEPKRLARLVAQLDSERFGLRRQAELELEALAELAAPALRQALNAQPALELRRRLERLLQHLDGPPPPERLRQLRSIAVLEHAGGAEARQLLQVLSLGAPEAHLTQEARAALDRMIPK